mmetsp:Transcript_924/g.1653  ORF Transcript_924/g.1653 Transcript_924/m.1653 type:complete len:95 (-) Transcript_924:35-319(-)
MCDIASFLVRTCKSGELLQISYSLDAFYEIFSEDFYDSILKDLGVINDMRSGEPMLKQMFMQAKASKKFSNQEIAVIENAMENLLPFIDYKAKI